MLSWKAGSSLWLKAKECLLCLRSVSLAPCITSHDTMTFWFLIFIALTVSVILFFLLDLVRLVDLLQTAMLEEQKRCGDLSRRLQDGARIRPVSFAGLCASTVQNPEKQTTDASNRSGREGQSVQRKSLSALHREKKEREKTAAVVGDWDQREGLRDAVRTVLGDIIGPDSTQSQESPKSASPALGRQILLTPTKQQTALDRESLLNSQERILEQVRRARKDGSLTPVSHSPTITLKTEERQSWHSSNEPLTPLKSILKKRSDSTPTESSFSSTMTTELSKSPFTNSERTTTLEAGRLVRTVMESHRTVVDGLQTESSKQVLLMQQEVGTDSVTSAQVSLKSTSPSVSFAPVFPPPPPPSQSPPPPFFTAARPSEGEVFRKNYLPDIIHTLSTRPEQVSNGHATPTNHKMEEVPELPHALRLTRVDVTENGAERLVVEENSVCREWDPTPLLNYLYQVNYLGKQETKKNRFINMEGHLEHLPMGLRAALTENAWKPHYFKTKEGRLLWFQTPYADDFPLGEVLLSGAEVDMNREESTLVVHGGRDGSHLTLRCPSNLLEKWRQALLNHAASSISDTYVQPFAPPLPHSAQPLVIIELGSCSLRAGLLTEEPSLPSIFFPAIAAVRPDGSVVVGVESLRPEIRHGATLIRPIRPTHSSVDRYTVDTEILPHLLRKVFRDLDISPSTYNVLLSVPQNLPVSVVGEVMRSLCKLGVQGVSVARHPCLVLYSYDVTTGVVLDIGDRLNIVPIVDGYVVQNAIVSLPYGGSQIRDALRDKLCEQNIGIYAFMSTVERFILRYILEESCYTAPDFEAEMAHYEMNPKEVDVNVSLDRFDPTPEMLKDFRVGSGRFSSTEGLMHPKRWGLDVQGLPKLLFNSIQTAPMDSRRSLYRNIYLSGGCSLVPGLAERLETELGKLVAASIQVQVHMSPWRYHAAYLGAQILGASAQFHQAIVSPIDLDAFLRKLVISKF